MCNFPELSYDHGRITADTTGNYNSPVMFRPRSRKKEENLEF